MSESIQSRILSHLKSEAYQPSKPLSLAKDLSLHDDDNYPSFREALRGLMDQGRVILGGRGAILLPGSQEGRHELIGTYSHNRRGFGFVSPADPTAKEDLFIPPGRNMGALTGDKVRASIDKGEDRDGKPSTSGKIIEILERGNSRFVGELAKVQGRWYVLPDGNTLTMPISTPDAGSRHLRAGTKVVVELTSFPDEPDRGGGGGGREAVGVITEVLGEAGEKDVDLRSVIIQHNLPGEFPDAVKEEARRATESFNPEVERRRRIDLSDQLVVTIDPDDAKDYDDAISLRMLDDGRVELGVHIADVSHFVTEGSALDDEAKKRGNSVYFPGHVIPMLPEILSNGVCSLQEGVPRLCKSAFITIGEDSKPVSAKFAETLITSAKRLRYREAQDILDGKDSIFHPDGNKKRSDYPAEVIELLMQMDTLAKRIQKRRHAAGQLVLDLPEIELKLDEGGKVIGTEREDTSFTHTLIEMFMVEANEAVARLLSSIEVPFIRRIHPEPDLSSAERLHKFVTVAGHKLPKELDRHAIQKLVMSVRGMPESYAINLAVLKSLTRAEYSPQVEGHFALASQHYTHFTSPIRRYADLMIHRLLKRYLEAREQSARSTQRKSPAPGGKRARITLDDVPTFDELVTQGRHMSFTERRAESAERELRQVKILTLLAGKVGEDFKGVVTGITNFGIFVQLTDYLIEGLIRYEDLMDDWWDVDEKAGVIRGQRTGRRIGIGDTALARVARVDPARRELSLMLVELTGRVARQDITPVEGESSGRRSGGGGPRGGGGGPRGGGGGSRDGAARGGGGRSGRTAPVGKGKPGPAKRGGPAGSFGGRRDDGKGGAPRGKPATGRGGPPGGPAKKKRRR